MQLSGHMRAGTTTAAPHASHLCQLSIINEQCVVAVHGSRHGHQLLVQLAELWAESRAGREQVRCGLQTKQYSNKQLESRAEQEQVNSSHSSSRQTFHFGPPAAPTNLQQQPRQRQGAHLPPAAPPPRCCRAGSAPAAGRCPAGGTSAAIKHVSAWHPGPTMSPPIWPSKCHCKSQLPTSVAPCPSAQPTLESPTTSRASSSSAPYTYSISSCSVRTCGWKGNAWQRHSGSEGGAWASVWHASMRRQTVAQACHIRGEA